MTSPHAVRPDRYRAGGRLPRWAKVVIALLVAVVVAVVAVVALLVWALSGLSNGLRGPTRPSDRTVVAARRAAGPELDALTRDTLAALGPLHELARVRTQECREGQNNWKIHDGYTLRCEVSDGVVLAPVSGQPSGPGTGPTSSVPDVSPLAAALDATLRAHGWTPTGETTAMTAPATSNLRYLTANRYGRYTLGTSARQLLEVDVTTRTTAYQAPTDVEGDTAAYGSALRGPGVRVVVHTTVRYVEDD